MYIREQRMTKIYVAEPTPVEEVVIGNVSRKVLLLFSSVMQPVAFWTTSKTNTLIQFATIECSKAISRLTNIQFFEPEQIFYLVSFSTSLWWDLCQTDDRCIVAV